MFYIGIGHAKHIRTNRLARRHTQSLPFLRRTHQTNRKNMQTLQQRTASLIIGLILSACAHTEQLAFKPEAKKRNPAARQAFLKANPCPATGKNTGACPGYIVDHIVPIKRGGGDHPYNMQWQTVENAKDKDRWE